MGKEGEMKRDKEIEERRGGKREMGNGKRGGKEVEEVRREEGNGKRVGK